MFLYVMRKTDKQADRNTDREANDGLVVLGKALLIYARLLNIHISV